MKEYVTNLKQLLKESKDKASKINYEASNEEDTVFVYPTNEGFLNPKYISFEHYFQISALEEFIKNNADLTNEQVLDVLQQDEDFVFLLELNGKIDNMIEELKRHGAKSVAIMYVSDKMYPKDANINM